MCFVLILLLPLAILGSSSIDGLAELRQNIADPNGYFHDKKDRFTLIQRIVASVSKTESPFRKYSDGSVMYLGKMLSVWAGILPKTMDMNEFVIIFHGFKIYDVLDDGCRIAQFLSNGNISEKDIFVKNLPVKAYSDREYGNLLMLRYVGSYEYFTVNGSSRTIPKYEAGKEITKEEYLKALGK
jgi:hypothetical protein